MAFIPAPHSASRPDRKQIVISSDTTNYNLASDLTNNYGWDGTSPIDAQVTINPGVSVSATATTAPAFHADLVSGSTLTLDNHGVIVGKGGTSSGAAGGHAISLQDVDATINNIPSRNLISKSEALDHGDWTLHGSPTVTANANSKNIIRYSQKIQSWTKSSTTVVAEAMIAPDGTKTMDTIEVEAGSTYIWGNRSTWFNVATSTLHTVSAYMKHSGSNQTLINFMNPSSPYTSLGRLYTNWSGGTPTVHSFAGDGATGTPVLEDVGNDIWRISFQVMSSATATAAGLAIYPYVGQTGNDPVGVWGVQIEQITQSLGTTLVDGASQSGTTLIVDGFTVQPQAGDKFTVAGISGTFTINSATTLSSTESTLTLAETLPSSPADDAVVTFTVAAAYAKLSAYEETGGSSNPPIASPINGSATADLFQRTSTSGQYIHQYVTKPTKSQTYTFSCYAKRGVGDFFSMRMQGNYPSRADAVFNLKTGTIKNSQLEYYSSFSNPSATIDSVGGGWYRCTFTVTTDPHTHLYALTTANSRGVPIDYTDVIANSSVYLWGFQLELTDKNLYRSPEDLSNNNHWIFSGTVTADAAVNPVDGAMTADKMQKNATSSSREQTVTLVAGQTYIHSVYLKNINASTSRLSSWNNNGAAWLGYVSIVWAGGLPGAAPTLTANYGASNEIAEDVGNGWWRISYRETTAAGSGPHAHGLTASINSVGTGLYAYGFQVELLTADGKPSPYIPVSRNLLDYPETPSKLFTTNNSGTITDNYDIAPDGTMTAALVADNSTSVGSFMQKNISIPDDSSKYTWSFYVKKDENVARFPVFWLNFFGNSIIYNHMNFNTKTGEIFNAVASTGRLTAQSVSAGDYWRVSMTVQNDSSGNNGIAIRVDPAKVSNFTTSVFGTSDSTMTGSIIFWGSQLEKGAKNLVSYPEDFSNAYWTKVAGATAVNNPNSVNINPYSENAKLNYTTHNTTTITENVAAAPDGKFTADRIEDTATATVDGVWGVRYAQKNLSIPANTSTYTWSFYVLKDSNTSRVPLFYMGLYNGSIGNQILYCWLNTSTGALQNASGANAFTSTNVESVGDYWKLSLTGTNNGENNILYTQIWPAGASSMGGSLSASVTGSIVFAHSQVQSGSIASAYEPTFGAAAPKILAPNGTETANLMTAGNSAYGGIAARRYVSSSSIPANTSLTASIYCKKINHRYIGIRLPSNIATLDGLGHTYTFFDFDTASFTEKGTLDSTSVETLPNGWYRIAVTGTMPSTITNTTLDFALVNSTGASNYTPAGTETVYFWGAQLERGPLTPYEEASNYIAVGNKSTRYQPFDDGVVTTLGGLGTSSSTPRILGGGGGGGSGGASQGHGSSEDTENPCSGGTPYTAGGAGGNGAGPGAQTAGSGGSNASGTGGSGGGYGAAGSSGTQGNATGCNAHNHGVGSGGAAGKAIHLVSNATLTLRNNGTVMGATA